MYVQISHPYITNMFSSKYFAINDGPNAGVYCSYCGKKLSPIKNPDADDEGFPYEGGFFYQCDCADARAELLLLEQQAQVNQKLETFYTQREKTMKKTQLSKHYENMELQLKEMKQSLLELDSDETSDKDPTVTPAKDQFEAVKTDSLKMDKPKLPNFKQG